MTDTRRSRDLARRQKVTRAPCILCHDPMGGRRMELGATWVAHAACFREYRAQALERPELLGLTPDQLDERLRAVLTVLAVRRANADQARARTLHLP